jgi:hypothetical protein
MHDTKYLVCSFLSVGMLFCFHFLKLLGWVDLTPVAVQEARIGKKRTELGSILPNGYDALSVAPDGGFNVVDGVAAMV